MTVETRTTIQLGDITEVEIECTKCHARIIWNPRDADHFIPLLCKKCDTPFFIRNSQEHRDLLQLLSLINTYSHTGNYHLRFSLGNPEATRSCPILTKE
jgi:DNA-directed RNA polymerase subunit RPC12/RpoP